MNTITTLIFAYWVMVYWIFDSPKGLISLEIGTTESFQKLIKMIH